MFLTKKSLKKILVLVIAYFVLATVCLISSLVYNFIGISEKFLLVFAIVFYLLGILFFFWGRYAEGEGKLISAGLKLVRNELKPAEFIRQYESLKNSSDLVIKKPSFNVFQLTVAAYCLLQDKEKELATVNEWIEVAKDKKKTYAKLSKISFLFSNGKTGEAEALFNEVRKQKLDVMSNTLAEGILKNDRAMAMGDYKTAEVYFQKLLESTFPKLDNAGKLVTHYNLGEVYEKLNEPQKAVEHYEYCANFGGETAIREVAAERLKQLKS